MKGMALFFLLNNTNLEDWFKVPAETNTRLRRRDIRRMHREIEDELRRSASGT